MAYIRHIGELSNKIKGNRGENIACKFLIDKKFEIIARNYRKKWGEIDIIAKKDNIIHFFEVKGVTANFPALVKAHRPEENVHLLKVKHIKRMIETYLSEKSDGLNTPFCFHVLCVYMNTDKRLARVKWLNDIIL